MGRHRNQILPSYRLHKQTGKAVVSLPIRKGKYRDILLGPWNTDESRREYSRIINEWLAAGKLIPPANSGRQPQLSISELCLFFWKHAESHYRRPDGTPSGELDHFHRSLDPLEDLYSRTPAKDFGPRALKAIRQQMIDGGRLCRKVINSRIEHIKRFFRWAVSEEFVPSSVYEALRAVAGLRRGHPNTRERPKVRAVPEQHIEAVLPFLSPQIAAMVQIQRLIGARPTEICTLRGRNIDRGGAVWWYVIDPNELDEDGKPLDSHKTGGHESEDGSANIKSLPIGPKAQELLRPWLRENADDFLFQPAEARQHQNAERRNKRKTPLTPSQRKRKPKAVPKRSPGERYDHHAYARAITRACESAKVHHWHPHQLKHNCATTIRKHYGVESSRIFLGHSKLSSTEIYAEVDRHTIEKIALERG